MEKLKKGAASKQLTQEKSGRGRPALPPEQRQGQVAVRFPPEMLAEIDAMVRARLDRPERSAMVRELIAEAIAARKRKR